MRRIAISPAAEADLFEIAAFIASDNPAPARSFVDELEARCVGLLDMPVKGRSARSSRRGCRTGRT